MLHRPITNDRLAVNDANRNRSRFAAREIHREVLSLDARFAADDKVFAGFGAMSDDVPPHPKHSVRIQNLQSSNFVVRTDIRPSQLYFTRFIRLRIVTADSVSDSPRTPRSGDMKASAMPHRNELNFCR